MKSPRLLLLYYVCLSLASCARSPRLTSETSPPRPHPAAVIVQREISGTVLGKPLKSPFGIAVDFSGDVFVVDAGNDRLIRFNADLKPQRDMGGFGREGGLFNRPTFVSVDRELNLAVSDEGNRRVSLYNSRLLFSSEVAFTDNEDPLKFGLPSGVGFAGYGEVWVADRTANRVAVFDNVGKFDRFVGDFGSAGGPLKSPEKIINTRSGDFVVCDAGNARLVMFDAYGNFIREVKASILQYPIAAAVGNGELWVLDGATGALLCFGLDGGQRFETGPSLPGSQVSLRRPSDIAVLPDGRLLLSDSGNNRLVVCQVIYHEE